MRVYLDALALESERAGHLAPSTVYIGGGTPTSLPDDELDELFAILRGGADLSAATEFTVEANPGTVDERRLCRLRELGADRLSLGVQTFDDRRLRELGRAHAAREALASFAAARAVGFDNISVDLIFARPGETLDEVRADVRRAVALGPEHVSVYGLTYEPGTRMAAMRDAGEFTPADEELERAMYLEVIALLAGAGFAQYEISAFARGGRESRHNRLYWEGGDYVGLGPSAASFIRGERRKNTSDLAEYAGRLARGEDPAAERERLSPMHAARERAVLMLRTRRGIDPAEFRARTGLDLDAVLGEAGARMFAGGWLERASGRVRLSDRALPVADTVRAEIV